MAYRSSGNATVDAMSTIAITGNVVPQEWYKSILRDNGKPHLLAIAILADIVYWYRPTEIRNEATGRVVGWKKRFKGDALQKSYQQYADTFGESRRTIKNAMDLLERLGVIEKSFRDLKLSDGRIMYNQMFVSLFPQALVRLSYPSDEDTPCKTLQGGMKNSAGGVEKNCRGRVKNSAIPPEKFCGTYTENNTETTDIDSHQSINQEDIKTETYTDDGIGYGYRSGDLKQTGLTVKDGEDKTDAIRVLDADKVIRIHAERDADKLQDYLPDTSENDSMSQDIDDQVLALIRENIDYDTHMTYDDPGGAMAFDELYRVIEDAIRGHPAKVRIGSMEYAYDVVKSRLMKLTSEHLDYVRSSILEHTGEIRNMKNYMLAALYNAPATMSTYYRQRVSRDLRYADWGNNDSGRENHGGTDRSKSQ